MRVVDLFFERAVNIAELPSLDSVQRQISMRKLSQKKKQKQPTVDSAECSVIDSITKASNMDAT